MQLMICSDLMMQPRCWRPLFGSLVPASYATVGQTRPGGANALSGRRSNRICALVSTNRIHSASLIR